MERSPCRTYTPMLSEYFLSLLAADFLGRYAMADQRRVVHFRGHVQGVGFRYTTCQVAQRFDVTGTVCNLDDGSVRMIAEGDHATLDQFIAAIAAAMDGRIRGCSEDVVDATGEFAGFSIVHR